MLLHEILTPDRIRTPLRGTTKDAILRELVETLRESGAVKDPEAVLKAVLEREAVLTTGLGSGVGIPHGKSDSVSSLSLAAGISAAPVDFDALDGQPCRLFFLLVGPESAAGDHVKALSRISRLVRRDDVRERLAGVATPEQFHALIVEAESA
ncbi:MAG: putative IIA-like nitrogen-regulatory protein PtsN [Gemmatimonadetes bacterium]|nr:putative IIA-like nitrogen-regulatory protein PtsN [Gemmatimonadota bacterium]